MLEQGKLAEARSALMQSLAERDPKDGGPTLAQRMVLGRLELASGHESEARELLTAAMAQVDATTERLTTADLGDAIARVLPRDPELRRKADALVRVALAEYPKAGPLRARRLRQLEGWMAAQKLSLK
jgi:hypothetical protein